MTSRLDQRLAWARATLDLDDDASGERACARMLRLVTEEEFVPPEGAMQAFRTLQADAAGVAELEDPPAFARQAQRELETEVAAITDQWFRLPPAERQVRWSELLTRCEQAPRARTWLQRLAPALSIDPADLSDQPQSVAQLAAKLGELFVALPADRGRLRAEFIAQAGDNRTQWEIAARQLQKQHPEWAALDPQLTRLLSTPAQSALPRLVATSPRPASSGRADLRWMWILLVVLIGFLARVPSLVNNATGGRNSPPTTSGPNVKQEDIDLLKDILRRSEERRRSSSPDSSVPQNNP